MDKNVEVLREALSAVAHQREEYKIRYEVARKRDSVWFNNYHCTRHALICTRLRLRDAEAMIHALLNRGNGKLPDIDIASDDLDVI